MCFLEILNGSSVVELTYYLLFIHQMENERELSGFASSQELSGF